MLYLIATLLGGYADRMRGTKGWTGTAGILLYCLCLALVLNIQNPLVVMGFVLTFLVGESFGYGSPWSAVLHSRHPYTGSEWWEVGVLKHDAPAGLIVRGALWGIPTLPLMYWEPQIIFFTISMMIAFPMAAIIGGRLDSEWWPWYLPRVRKGVWDKAEAIRGWLSVGITSLLMFVSGFLW